MSLRVDILTSGSCRHPERVIKKGASFSPITFPASVVLIKHPAKGNILFDTGYSDDFFRVTRKFPERLYSLVTPVTLGPNQSAVARLATMNVAPDDINYVIISHFHADHISGAKDFPNAEYIFMDEAYAGVRNLSRLRALRHGFLPALLPDDFSCRARPLSRSDLVLNVSPIPALPLCFDIFADGSILGVPLPGHAPGHMGIWVTAADKDYLFAGDACWVEEQFLYKSEMSWIAKWFQHDIKRYHQTIDQLSQANQDQRLSIVPCHCAHTHARLASGG